MFYSSLSWTNTESISNMNISENSNLYAKTYQAIRLPTLALGKMFNEKIRGSLSSETFPIKHECHKIVSTKRK
jgi:hypothetical protein